MLKIENPVQEDAEVIISIHNDCLLDTFFNILESKEINRIILDTLNRIKVMKALINESLVKVLKYEGEIIAYATFGQAIGNFDNCGEIYDIFILKLYRNKGYGKILFKSILKDLKFNKVIARCFEKNNYCNFYKKLNGKLIKKEKTKYGDKLYSENIYEFNNC